MYYHCLYRYCICTPYNFSKVSSPLHIRPRSDYNIVT